VLIGGEIVNKKIISIFICTLMLTVVSSAAMNINNQQNDIQPIKKLIRMDISNQQSYLPKDLDIISGKAGEWIEVIISEDRLYEIANFDYEIIIEDIIKHDNSVRGQYHTLAQMESILEDIADDYPDITDLYSIGTTYQGRDIWCLEISDNAGVDEGEPGVFLMGLHHAREWPTVEICLYLCDQLTSEYGSNQQITDLVDDLRIWVVTCVNPDGYYYCHDQGNDWRKNRRPIPGGIGIDLNRNYGGSSNGDADGAWGSIGQGSISHNPSNSLYCGPEPFSEAETQAVRDIFLQNNISATISWHTHGELVLYSWAYTYSSPPDSTYISQLGQDIAQEISGMFGGTYTPQSGANLYPTTGDTTDWAYGHGHYVQARPTFAYTIEACTSFHPSESYLDQVVAENFDGALVLLEEAEDIKNTVIPRVVTEIDEMETDEDGVYTVSWDVVNDDANPTKFQLDELIGPSYYTDDAESGTGYWNNDGFSCSTKRSHSSSHSFKSGTGNEKVFSMTTKDPIFVTPGMNLELWTWYDIEFNYDYAMVEVSTNGLSYDLLEGFTGTSSGWEEKQYNLSAYEGDSIYIRLRYITDGNTEGDGIYFDDIYPVCEWDSITTLSDTITDDYYEISGKTDGIYYYRVKGYNSEHDWCDFCTIEDIQVDFQENNPPEKPTINGPIKGVIRHQLTYKISTTDPENQQVYYYLEWDDGDTVDWDGPYDSGEEIELSHVYNKVGTYRIRVKAKDIYDFESDWETLEVVIPKNKAFTFNFLNRFPRLSILLEQLLNLAR
jgi:murein tripeptide amidase MpaA